MVDSFFAQPGNDGRRRSNPLLDPSTSTVKAPNLQLWRHITADDAALVAGALPTIVSGGVNFASYMGGNVHFVPRNGLLISSTLGGTSTISLKILEWSAGANRFIDTGQLLAAQDAGEAGAFSFDANGRIIFIHVTGITGGQSCSLYTNALYEEER